MVAKFTKKYLEDNESVFIFVNTLLHREDHDYEIVDDARLTSELHVLQDAIRKFEDRTGYYVKVKIK